MCSRRTPHLTRAATHLRHNTMNPAEYRHVAGHALVGVLGLGPPAQPGQTHDTDDVAF